MSKEQPFSTQKIIVAMSGGVDSSVAAALLKEQGYDVVGVTLRLLARGETGFGCCGSPEDTLIAKRSAEKAGIPHYVLDYAADFEKDVITYFVDSYLDGETPNPCLACNKSIKFDKLRAFAASSGASGLATGHYARIVQAKEGRYTVYRLFEARDPAKDQSYVLYNATQESLAHTLFPIGDRPKTEIRELAKRFGLPNADKSDSQEICFVPNRDYGGFIKMKLEERGDAGPTTRSGPIKDLSGNVMGEHRGVAFYTVGQRKGLGLTTEKPYYVVRLDADTNTVVVGPDQANLSRELYGNDATWVAGGPPAARFKALVKIRYKHEPAPALVRTDGRQLEVVFDEPQRAITPGQAAVVYRWDEFENGREVLGGATIQTARGH